MHASLLSTGSFQSIFLGRIVEYPDLMSYLVNRSRSDSLWLRSKGRPRKGGVNLYVQTILATHPLIGKMNRLLKKVGYRISGVSVEKVLVGRYKDIPRYHGQKFTGGLPFDAQLYVLLKKIKKSTQK